MIGDDDDDDEHGVILCPLTTGIPVAREDRH